MDSAGALLAPFMPTCHSGTRVKPASRESNTKVGRDGFRTARYRPASGMTKEGSDIRVCSTASGEQRRDASHSDAAILTLRRVGRNLEILLAVALRHQVLGRNLETLAQGECGRF